MEEKKIEPIENKPLKRMGRPVGIPVSVATKKKIGVAVKLAWERQKEGAEIIVAVKK